MDYYSLICESLKQQQMEDMKAPIIALVIMITLITTGLYLSYKEDIRRSNIEYQIKRDSLQKSYDNLTHFKHYNQFINE